MFQIGVIKLVLNCKENLERKASYSFPQLLLFLNKKRESSIPQLLLFLNKESESSIPQYLSFLNKKSELFIPQYYHFLTGIPITLFLNSYYLLNRYSNIAFAPSFPACTASTTSFPPFTQSPPANTPRKLVAACSLINTLP